MPIGQPELANGLGQVRALAPYEDRHQQNDGATPERLQYAKPGGFAASTTGGFQTAVQRVASPYRAIASGATLTILAQSSWLVRFP